MVGNKKKAMITAKDIAYIAMFAAILFVQEQILTFLPNIQLSVFLIVLYSKKLGFVRTTFIIIIHVLLDNLVMGSFNPFYTPTMFIGWMFIPLLVCTMCKKIESPIILAIVGVMCSFLYSWTFILPNYIMYSINPWIYFVSDIVFEIILATCSFITIFLLYKPCAKLFDRMMSVDKHI